MPVEPPPSNKAEIAIHIYNKIYFQPEVIKKKHNEGHSIFITEKYYQEELLILNIYDTHAREATFIKETLLMLKAHIAPTKW